MDILVKNELYTCSLDEFLPVPENAFFLLYSPLSTIASLASAKEINSICNCLQNKEENEEIQELVDALLDRTESEEALSKRIRGVDGFVNISLLMNNKCNFSCSYCYSAHARSLIQLSENRLLAAIDYFIDKQRTREPKLSLTFLGGGEPMLSWNLIEKGVLYANERAAREGFGLWHKIITNGSLFTDTQINFIAKNNIEITVSYEILEDIQNLQRKHFELVTDNIKRLLQQNVMLSFNSVITPQNVKRQTEMVQEVIRNFPQIDYLSFEPLMELNEWSAGMLNNEFYDLFTEHFIAARKLAGENGIELSCTLLRNVDCTLERYCAGEFAVCPDGSLTICPCVSSDEETHYHSYLYGQINEERKVAVDENKLSLLLEEDVHAMPECTTCFAKWNCGGGCIHANKINNTNRKQLTCDFIRKFTRRVLWERIKNEYENEFQQPILDILTQANPLS
ncbi:MAG: radical SAM protein [Tannerellaceae bacterium]|nr:radical SAM protein [Tannerellaceae bacterium]